MAKEKHVACIVDPQGQMRVRPRSFTNDAAGYPQWLPCLRQVGRADSILIGMEATGHYWYSLYEFLTRHGYTVIVLNPLQTAAQAKQAIRKCKTDKHDAVHIATLLRTYQYKAVLVPGATTRTIVSLYGEVDPIEAFAHPAQLVAFTGLDPKVFQTGQYDAPVRHLSKRGSPYLRYTIWHMAHRAVCQEGPLRDSWRRKRRENKHHLVAVTATANKLCRIIWRIMTDRRDYVPNRETPHS